MATATLPPLTSEFADNRESIHRLALYILAEPLRKLEDVETELTWTPGGIGTILFGRREQIRVSGVELVHQRAGRLSIEMVSTLREAAAQIDIDIEAVAARNYELPAGDLDEFLPMSEEGSETIGALFEFAKGALGECRHNWRPLKPSRSILAAETLNMSFTVADPRTEGIEFVFGTAAGDEYHPNPYFYVKGPAHLRAEPPQHDGYWNAPFGSAFLYEELPANPDNQRPAIVNFFQAGLLGLTRQQT